MKVMLLQANLEVDDASMKVLYASSWKKRDDRVVGDRGSPSWPPLSVPVAPQHRWSVMEGCFTHNCSPPQPSQRH